MAEFPTLGSTCSMTTCKLLDFLPFTCAFCQKVFCSDHRTPDTHDCDRSNVSNETKILEDVVYYNCCYSNCTSRELIPVKCSLCENNFCMKHRLSENHKCTKLRPAPIVKTVKLPDKTAVTLPIKAPKFRGAKSEKTMKQVNLMKLKMKAIGDKGIPETDRTYFNVFLPPVKAGEAPKTQPYFFSVNWTVGKVVDFIAEKEKIPNYNNVATEKKLQLILTKDESVLPFSQILSDLRENGLDDGSDLRLD